jgi:hypothetical protein
LYVFIISPIHAACTPITLWYDITMLGTQHILGAGTVTDCGLDGRGVRVRVNWTARFSHIHVVQTHSAICAASYPMGIVGSFPGRQTYHSPPTNAWIYTSAPAHVFMA